MLDTAFASSLAAYLKIDPARLTAEPHGIDVIVTIDGATPDGGLADGILDYMNDSPVREEWINEHDRSYSSVIAGGLIAAPVEDEEAFWSELPPSPSPRFVEWSARIAAGWRPSDQVRSLGYHDTAIWYGLWIAEAFALRELIAAPLPA